MDPVGKILGGVKEKLELKRELVEKRIKKVKLKGSEKSHKLHERIETKGEEVEEHLHKHWGHKKY
jgi:hypothetical protein